MSQPKHGIPELDGNELRKFGVTTSIIVAGLFGILFPWLLQVGPVLWPWVLSVILVVPALVAPTSLRPIYRGWMRFGLLMSRITTPFIMGLVFFLVITPVALVMKLAIRDPLNRKLDHDKESYRVTSHRTVRESIERPY
jgi:O-antigen/teichoic acid export membrane protein